MLKLLKFVLGGCFDPLHPNGVDPVPHWGGHSDPLLQMWNPHLSYPRSGSVYDGQDNVVSDDDIMTKQRPVG